MKTFTCIVLFVVTFMQVSCDESCPEHEVAVLCKSSCEPTCRKPSPEACTFTACQKGCECKPHLIRDLETGNCVPPYKCPQECREHEVWTPCGAACVQTCQTLEHPLYCPPSQACTPGCICSPGYIFDDFSNSCVERKDCPKEEE